MSTAILALLFALVPAALILFAVIWRIEGIRFASVVIGVCASLITLVLALAFGAVLLAKAITGQ